ncbi:MAG: SH3 domain-containing protein [Candidatus Dojkabacteria bacterium]|jgi:hypothetical protein|nr:SH3 domain-containing protein [Candidatus Dojkabacteria bacterium]
MNIKKLTTKIILGTLLLCLSTFSTYAGFGISPTDFNHKFLKPGSTFEKEFMISRSVSLEEMDITIEPTFEGISSWFTYTPSQTFKFKSGQSTITFKIKAQVPEDAKFQDYDGVFRVKAVPSNQEVKGVTITQGIRLDSDLVVTEEDVRSLSILSIKVLDSELNQPIKVQLVGENLGNVDASPTIKVKIMNLNMELLEEHEIVNFGFIKPNQTSTLTGEFDTNLPSGEYFIEVQVLLDAIELRKDRLVFLINNIPVDETSDENDTFSFINSIFTDFKENFPSILIGSLSLLLVYYLIGKMWKLSGLAQKAGKWWALLLGSHKYTRVALSFFLALQIMLLVIFYPLVKEISNKEDAEIGETQGAQDSTLPYPTLNVFPEIAVPKYMIYQNPDINSQILYEAKEDETFDVIEENENWYKVKIENGQYGWLQKVLVKSNNTQER